MTKTDLRRASSEITAVLVDVRHSGGGGLGWHVLPSFELHLTTTHLSSHPVCRRPTHRGAGVVPGVQVERATVRTTWTPGAASARLCLGRWQAGWELPAHATTPAGTRERRPLHLGA
jgi:hypothetical protein